MKFRELFRRRPKAARRANWRRRLSIAGIAIALFGIWLLGWYWSREPDVDFRTVSSSSAGRVVGMETVDAMIEVCGWLLDKPGGYLSNDMMPPSVWLDNMPNFEFGVLVQCQDLAKVMRNDFSRSQSQSTEHPDLAAAEPALNFDNDSWILPPTESRYRDALESIASYRAQIADTSQANAQFYARADNLREWLAVVERRLGNLSQRLSASVARSRVNTDRAGEPASEVSTTRPEVVPVKTPWLEIDDVFYEARGTAWALLQFLRAIEVDFVGVLEDKNAVVSIRQIIRELEGAMNPVSSPVILNGRGFGWFANHSLVLASYISRAHSAVTDVRSLLEQG